MAEVTLNTLADSIKELKEVVTSVAIRLEAVEHRLVSVENRLESVENRVVSLENRVASLEGRMDRRFEAMDRRFETMEGSIHWVVTAQVTMAVTLVGAAIGIIAKVL